MSKRSIKAQEKKERILAAAVRIFAKKGYHGCRVSDIADEADIAYGLVYHYFGNKETVLLSIFEDNWAMFVQVLQSICEDNTTDLSRKIHSIVSFSFGLYRRNPAVVDVIILDLVHSHEFRTPALLERFEWSYRIIQRMFNEAIERGEIGTHDSSTRALMLLGNLETLFTAMALRMVSSSPEHEATVAAEMQRVYSAP